MPLPERPNPTIRAIPGVGPSRDTRGGFPALPRFIGDILIGAGVILVAAAVVGLIVSAPPVVPVTGVVLVILWLLGLFARWVYEGITRVEPDPAIPPPPPSEK